MHTFKETLVNSIAIFSLLLLPSFLHADDHLPMEEVVTERETITVPLSQKPNSNISRPKRGQSKQQVQLQFGNPVKEIPARGKPPISKWIYDDFSVIFESDYVIHSVINAQP